MGNTTTNSNIEKYIDNFSEKDRLCGFINVNIKNKKNNFKK